MKFCACAPSCGTVNVPLRSCSTKLKPPAAPKPGIDGGRKGKITASGSLDSSRRRWAMMAGIAVSGVVRSPHGLSRRNIEPTLDWNELVSSAMPPTVLYDSTPGVAPTMFSTRRSTASVRSSDAPLGSCTFTMTMPWSSVGTNPPGTAAASRDDRNTTTARMPRLRIDLRASMPAAPT